MRKKYDKARTATNMDGSYYRGSPNNTDFGESKILCYVNPCKLGTILVLKPGIFANFTL